MKLAIPDLISNSYFPALAAAELGFFEREGLDVTAELIFPVDRAYEALRDGAVDFVGGAAHGALAAFTEWRGVKLLGALAQGMYWFLVMRKELGIIKTPEVPANLCFGGSDMKTIFFTARTSVYSLRVKVPGLPGHPYRK